MTTQHTPGPIAIRKCPCGDRICDQHILSTQGSAGFSFADATLYASSPALLEALETADRRISMLRAALGTIAKRNQAETLDAEQRARSAAIALARGTAE